MPLQSAKVNRSTHSAGVRVTEQTSITTSGSARVRAWVHAEIAIATAPNATSLPVVRNREADGSVCSGFPASRWKSVDVFMKVKSAGKRTQLLDPGRSKPR